MMDLKRKWNMSVWTSWNAEVRLTQMRVKLDLMTVKKKMPSVYIFIRSFRHLFDCCKADIIQNCFILFIQAEIPVVFTVFEIMFNNVHFKVQANWNLLSYPTYLCFISLYLD